jgi:hypothetical protein
MTKYNKLQRHAKLKMYEIDFIKTSIIFVNVEQDIQLFSS